MPTLDRTDENPSLLSRLGEGALGNVEARWAPPPGRGRA
ncbi:hypothetical protein BX257_8407 [Streptomyces sp. 3212.3]|nr:hypothetical protein BX257_8407 [Streptomyces sp. 3212.3]